MKQAQQTFTKGKGLEKYKEKKINSMNDDEQGCFIQAFIFPFTVI